MPKISLVPVLCVIVALWLILGNGVLPTLQPTAATYVYEKDSGSPPPPVLAALDKLNRQGIVATTFEEDTTDADGQVPEQYKAALPAARAAGLPSLVVSAGDTVLKVVKDPKTEEQVMEAAQ